MHCIDRSGREVTAKDTPTGLLRILYCSAAGRLMLPCLTRPGLSDFTGRLLDTGASRILNRAFIRRQGIDMSEYEPGPYRSFNELFRRRIRAGARPVDGTEDTVVSPCDGRLQVFPIGDSAEFEIKGISYTMEQLLRDPVLAEKYCGGTLMLFRLGVSDYHRYIYPVSGEEGAAVRLDGILNTVSPVATERRPVYRENIREYTRIETAAYGSVLMMEIGALLVGRIVNVHPQGPVRRGEEKGYFEFGASSILLCFEKNAVVPDQELLKNTAAGYETLVRQGERVGCARAEAGE